MVQAKAKARITIKPLVDIIPCMGAVNVTLIDQPEVDFSVRMLGSCDLMAIPGIRQTVLFFVSKVGRTMRSGSLTKVLAKCTLKYYRISERAMSLIPDAHSTMRFGSTAKVLLKCKLKYYRISE